MKCKSCKKEILDEEDFVQITTVPAECSEGYRKLGMSITLQYCIRCGNDVQRYIFEKNN